ncbi:MAG: anti-sigma regulatory factor [Cyanobacteriota bacterium]|nr:anti-sigma regulatory factor [Cyanobacteriota bacterium]
MQNVHSLTLPGNLEALQYVADFVKQVGSIAGLDKKAIYNLRLAVDEIATNIITHAYEETDTQGSLYLEASVTEGYLTIVIEDTGAAYDPRQAVPQEIQTIDIPLAQRPIGGLGIYLAIEGVDEFAYERINQRNRNIFRMQRRSLSTSS